MKLQTIQHFSWYRTDGQRRLIIPDQIGFFSSFGYLWGKKPITKGGVALKSDKPVIVLKKLGAGGKVFNYGARTTFVALGLLSLGALVLLSSPSPEHQQP